MFGPIIENDNFTYNLQLAIKKKIGYITNTSPCPHKRGGFYRSVQLYREQLASSQPMKQKMPQAPYSQLPAMDYNFCEKSYNFCENLFV
jgi:hypothetical protein